MKNTCKNETKQYNKGQLEGYLNVHDIVNAITCMIKTMACLETSLWGGDEREFCTYILCITG